MVHASIRMFIPPGKYSDVMRFLGPFAQQTRCEPGCLECNVYRDGEGGEVVLLDQQWSDKESLMNHLRTPAFHDVLVISELSTVRPEFRFETVMSRAGLELIEQAILA